MARGGRTVSQQVGSVQAMRTQHSPNTAERTRAAYPPGRSVDRGWSPKGWVPGVGELVELSCIPAERGYVMLVGRDTVHVRTRFGLSCYWRDELRPAPDNDGLPLDGTLLRAEDRRCL